MKFEKQDIKTIIAVALTALLGFLGFDANITPKVENLADQVAQIQDENAVQNGAYSTTFTIPPIEDDLPPELDCGQPYYYKYGAWYNYDTTYLVDVPPSPLPTPGKMTITATASDFSVVDVCVTNPSVEQFNAAYNRNQPDSLKRNITNIQYLMYRGRYGGKK